MNFLLFKPVFEVAIRFLNIGNESRSICQGLNRAIFQLNLSTGTIFLITELIVCAPEIQYGCFIHPTFKIGAHRFAFARDLVLAKLDFRNEKPATTIFGIDFFPWSIYLEIT